MPEWVVMASRCRDELRSNQRRPNGQGQLNDRRRAILHVIFRRGNKVTNTAIAAEVGGSSTGVRTHLGHLEVGGYIELNPLRLTFAGVEVVRGYRDD